MSRRKGEDAMIVCALVSCSLVVSAVSEPAKNPVPGYAKACGIELGVSSTKQLENKIGKGKVTVGGHSNSGRVWTFDHCIVRTDAFQRVGNHAYVDMLQIQPYGASGRPVLLRGINPMSMDSRWTLGGLWFGESLENCQKYMEAKDMPATSIQGGLERVDVRWVTVAGVRCQMKYTLDLLFGEWDGLSKIEIVVDRLDE